MTPANPDPNEAPPVLVNTAPPPESDLEKAPAILRRFDRYQGHGIRPGEVAILARLVRQYAPITEDPKDALPSVLSTPSCPGCGFIVEKRGEFCAACKEKQAAKAKPLFEVGPVPTPKYAQPGGGDAIQER
jgi:hypothetical protein